MPTGYTITVIKESQLFDGTSDTTRVCPHCHQSPPQVTFTAKTPWCRACTSERGRAWRLKNPDYASIYSKEWREKNPEKYLADNRQHAQNFYAEHRDEILLKRRLQRSTTEGDIIRAVRRAWYVAHIEEICAYQRLFRRSYFARYPLRRRKYQQTYRRANLGRSRLLTSRRNARKRGLPDTFTLAERNFMLSYWENTCAACGNQLGLLWTLHDDHWIPLSNPVCPGTVASNMIPLCGGYGGCNNTKSGKDGHLWLAEHFGARKGRVIEQRIAAYFTVVEARAGLEKRE